MPETGKPRVTAGDRQALADTLDVREAPTDGSATITQLRDAISRESSRELQSMGERVRTELAGELDEALLTAETDTLKLQAERVDAVREVGVPDGEREPAAVYRELVEPGWAIYDHLAEVGFFASVEDALPAFTPEHIDRTAHEFVGSAALTSVLADCGLEDDEQTALLMDVTDNDTRLSRWVPTRDIPEGVEFDVGHVPPLQQRAMGGGLLWLKALDRHLWQKEILVTEEMLDDAAWHGKAVLSGLVLLSRAARAIAGSGDDDLDDAQLTAALTAGTAILIVNQEELMQKVFWITEEKRAPTEAR